MFRVINQENSQAEYPSKRFRYFGPVLILVFLQALVNRDGVSQSQRPDLNGTTYYVDSASGQDTYGGTSPHNAWKTLNKINQTTFAPGDTILLKSGSSWSGQLRPKGSGTIARPIHIGKYGGDAKPVINGSGTVEDTLLLKNQEYWEVQDLDLTNTGAGDAVRRGVYVLADNYGEMRHIYLRSLTIHDVNGTDSNKVNGGIHYGSIGESKPSRFVDLRIENNRITHVDRSGIFGWSTHWVRSKWYPSLGVVIRGNILDDIGGDGIVVVATDGALVEYNVVGHANQRSAGYNVAIWPWSADNTIIQYNEAYGTRGQRDGEGYDSDWNSRNTIIQYNYSHDNDGGFLLICNDGGNEAGQSAGNVGTIVRYNISQNDHHRGINIAGPVDDSTIYNNTIYVGKNEKVDLLLYSDWKGWATGTHVYNNIFYVAGTAVFSYGVSRNRDGAFVTAPGFGKSSGNTFDSNIYFGIQPADDPHALLNDPMLIGPGSGGMGQSSLSGYGLRAASPAINSGKVIDHKGGKDFVGTPVPTCGGVDRGAMESKKCGPSQ